MKTKFVLYKDIAGEYRWRAYRGPKIVAEGGEGYKQRTRLRSLLVKFIDSLADGKYIITIDK